MTDVEEIKQKERTSKHPLAIDNHQYTPGQEDVEEYETNQPDTSGIIVISVILMFALFPPIGLLAAVFMLMGGFVYAIFQPYEFEIER